MPLQNRVDPFGEIHAVAARGMFTGNRGIIHDPATRTLLGRRWTTKAWIICACAYKDRPPRDVMGYRPNGRAGWTELFFLDEVTALAAGHRPCFTCRREAAKTYAAGFAKAFGIEKPSVKVMDDRLHAERTASGGKALDLGALPDGAMIHNGEMVYALRLGKLLPWSFAGYGEAVDLSSLDSGGTRLLTPLTTVAVLSSGFAPVWHPSAG